MGGDRRRRGEGDCGQSRYRENRSPNHEQSSHAISLLFDGFGQRLSIPEGRMVALFGRDDQGERFDLSVEILTMHRRSRGRSRVGLEWGWAPPCALDSGVWQH
jgi:hypothetical protein